MKQNTLFNYIAALGLALFLLGCSGSDGVGGVDAVSQVVEDPNGSDGSGNNGGTGSGGDQNGGSDTGNDNADGEYSQEQIDAGKSAYEQQCASCHGDDGNGTTPLFVNDTDFDSLYNTIHNTMPFGATNDCINDCATNVSAYLLTLYNGDNAENGGSNGSDDGSTGGTDGGSSDGSGDTGSGSDDGDDGDDGSEGDDGTGDNGGSDGDDGSDDETGNGAVTSGQVIYQDQCIACHGEKGDGQFPLFVKNTDYDAILSTVETTMPLGAASDCEGECAQNVSAYLVELYAQLNDDSNNGEEDGDSNGNDEGGSGSDDSNSNEEEGYEYTYVTADAYVEFGNADTNYGEAEALVSKLANANNALSRQSFIKFDVSNLQAVEGKTLEVFLQFYQVLNDGSETSAVVALNAVSNSWQENTLTWNSKPSVEVNLSSTTYGANENSQFKWREINISEYVNQQIAEGKTALSFNFLNESNIKQQIRSKEFNNGQFAAKLKTRSVPNENSDSELAEEIAAGKVIYETQCIACHGEKGDGQFLLFTNDTAYEDILSTVESSMPLGSAADCTGDCAENVSRYLENLYQEITDETDDSNTDDGAGSDSGDGSGSGDGSDSGDGADNGEGDDGDNQNSCDAPQWVSGTQYTFGQQVTNRSAIYSCKVAGWCASTADWAYEPGGGLYWGEAWNFVSACDASDSGTGDSGSGDSGSGDGSDGGSGDGSGDGSGGGSNEQETIPNAVSTVIANASSLNDRIGVSWSDQSENEIGFQIMRKVNQGAFEFLASLAENVTQYDDQSVAVNNTYQYQVTAYNNVGESSAVNSNPVLLSEKETAPIAPTQLAANKVDAGNDNFNINLSWQDNSTNETSFAVERKTSQSDWQSLASVSADINRYTDNAVAVGQSYFYRVAAINETGRSDVSNTAIVTIEETPLGETLFAEKCSACHKPGSIGGDLFDGFVQNGWRDADYSSFTQKVSTMNVSNCDQDCFAEITEWVWVTQWGYSLGDSSQVFDDRGVRGLRLLTPNEYANSVEAITGVTINDDELPQSFFEADFRYPGQAERGILLYDRVLEYFNLAEKIAQSFSPATIGCTESTCNDSSIRAIGRKVFRRPLSDAEFANYQSLVTNYNTRDMLAGMLVSPNFLYRVELGEWDAEKAAYKLNGYEVASELSFKLWGTTPDDSLLDKAANGQLSNLSGIGAEVDRMMADSRFAEHFVEFIRYYTKTYAATDEKPGLTQNVIDAMKQEQAKAVEYLLKNGSGNIDELFNPGYTFVDQALASHYGISGVTGSSMQKVTTDSNRGGVLHQGITQILNSDFAATSLVKRGKMIRENMMCHLMGVPSGVDPDTIELPSSPITTRERWNFITGPDASEGQCWACHQLMNEPGSALENFDQTGKFRETETAYNDENVTLNIDPAGSLRNNAGEHITTYANARELSQNLAQNSIVRQCFADSVYRFANGYETDNETKASFEQAQSNFDSQGDILSLVKELMMLESVFYRTDRE